MNPLGYTEQSRYAELMCICAGWAHHHHAHTQKQGRQTDEKAFTLFVENNREPGSGSTCSSGQAHLGGRISSPGLLCRVDTLSVGCFGNPGFKRLQALPLTTNLTFLCPSLLSSLASLSTFLSLLSFMLISFVSQPAICPSLQLQLKLVFNVDCIFHLSPSNYSFFKTWHSHSTYNIAYLYYLPFYVLS